MTVHRITIPLLLSIALFTSAIADDNGKDEWKRNKDRFELWTECRPVDLWVSVETPESNNLNMTQSRVETSVRARLRSARIFTDAIGIPPKKKDEYNYLEKQADQMTQDQKEKFIKVTVKFLMETPTLNVYVHVVGNGFTVKAALQKRVHDLISNITNYTNTWERSFTGTATNSSAGGDHILSGVSQAVDQFIDEYLRVNAPDC